MDCKHNNTEASSNSADFVCKCNHHGMLQHFTDGKALLTHVKILQALGEKCCSYFELKIYKHDHLIEQHYYEFNLDNLRQISYAIDAKYDLLRALFQI